MAWKGGKKQSGKGGKGGGAWNTGAWDADYDDTWSTGWGKGKDKWSQKSSYGGDGWETNTKGKGKGKGKKWQDADMDPANFTSRIKSPFQISKSILRASLDATGGAFVKSDWAPDDAAILAYENFVQALSTGNCHLLRRPGTGLSEMAGSMRHGLEVLRIMKNDPNTLGFLAIWEAMPEDVIEALDILDQKGPEADRSQSSLQEALGKVTAWFQANAGLYDQMKDGTIAAARLYLSFMAMMQGMVFSGDISAWAEMIPQSNSESQEFAAWQSQPNSQTKMCRALAKLMVERIEEEKQWNKGKGIQTLRRRRVMMMPFRSTAMSSMRTAPVTMGRSA